MAPVAEQHAKRPTIYTPRPCSSLICSCIRRLVQTKDNFQTNTYTRDMVWKGRRSVTPESGRVAAVPGTLTTGPKWIRKNSTSQRVLGLKARGASNLTQSPSGIHAMVA